MLAVKNINLECLSFSEEEKFLDVICTASRLKHPNIVALNGYCLERGKHLLVYDYFRNLTLKDALHSGAFKPLSWVLRLRIALGVALALDYLHTALSPPVAHGNIKAANVLLDENLMPRVCDCGLAILSSPKSNLLKISATDITTGDRGYIEPEHGRPGIGSRKRDIFAFGVLLLELLTGREPFDSSRPREEQYLAKWASTRLHDIPSLEQMVDPSIKSSFSSSKPLSPYANIIARCIQPLRQLRPPMAEIVDFLSSFSLKFNSAKSGEGDSTALDTFERSFRSANTRFIGSPVFSHIDVEGSFEGEGEIPHSLTGLIVEDSFEGFEEMPHSFMDMIVEDSFESAEEIPHSSLEIKVVEDSFEGAKAIPNEEEEVQSKKLEVLNSKGDALLLENNEEAPAPLLKRNEMADFDLNKLPDDEDDKGGQDNREIKKVANFDLNKFPFPKDEDDEGGDGNREFKKVVWIILMWEFFSCFPSIPSKGNASDTGIGLHPSTSEVY
ncbi:hypothetical protein RIF29_25107 [Crotalaria pallida]|uniref:Protein kinase domain-containing protein n=1 Tax=Crotalaria pallida TaxID=3830 RepID=A0AAN9EKZ2_CROPI